LPYKTLSPTFTVTGSSFLPVPAASTTPRCGFSFAVSGMMIPPAVFSSAAAGLIITPLHDRVIVKPAAAEEKTAGGIIIPDTAKEKPQRGVVLAAGTGKKDEPVTVKVGDNVLYGKYAGTEIQIDGQDLLIMRESDILAIV